jgi:hypothetical protein
MDYGPVKKPLLMPLIKEVVLHLYQDMEAHIAGEIIMLVSLEIEDILI